MELRKVRGLLRLTVFRDFRGLKGLRGLWGFRGFWGCRGFGVF